MKGLFQLLVRLIPEFKVFTMYTPNEMCFRCICSFYFLVTYLWGKIEVSWQHGNASTTQEQENDKKVNLYSYTLKCNGVNAGSAYSYTLKGNGVNAGSAYSYILKGNGVNAGLAYFYILKGNGLNAGSTYSYITLTL